MILRELDKLHERMTEIYGEGAIDGYTQPHPVSD